MSPFLLAGCLWLAMTCWPELCATKGSVLEGVVLRDNYTPVTGYVQAPTQDSSFGQSEPQ